MKLKFLFVLAFAALAVTSCKKDTLEDDKQLIEDYLAENGLTAEVTSEGVYYIIDSVGIGISPTRSDVVKVHYEGFLLDGTKFDSSLDRGAPSEFPLSGVIEGWQIGIPKFRETGSGMLLIPSSLAYGKNPPPGSGIPKNAVLRFTIELLEVL